MRCGFCNLFTQARPSDALAGVYLDVLRRQAERVRECVPDARFARFAVGGGTPTYLDEPGLSAVFDVAERAMGANLRSIPVAVEASPDTLTADKVALLKARGVDRVSVGIQSFFEVETAACGRPQTRRQVEYALGLLADARFPTLNLDLIYGLPGQTVVSWLASVEAALRYEPQELYLYPLYVRPLTGLGRSRKEWDDVRLSCYRAGRDLLLQSGFEQVSMRMFRRPTAQAAEGPVYCCQEDGMVGLGCGARSYTRRLHYALDYAVSPKGVKEIIADYLTRPDGSFGFAEHGFELNDGEQRRRYVLQSILNADGLSLGRYHDRFRSEALSDFPELGELIEVELMECTRDRVTPTDTGLERSDAIGPWLFSPHVRRLMGEYEPR
jgi:oxygen-independent coproporphyrinogen-3 oxidase